MDSQDTDDSQDAANPQSTPAEEFGPYLVYERLGVGGMATVHRAKKRGLDGFERSVALKRMLSHLTDDAEFISSFAREAKLASMLAHPNIAQIYEFGRVGDTYYIAMEHVDGFDVSKLLRYCHRHRVLPPVNVVLSILSELCDALEYAHTFVDENGRPHGIVHRDVSPSNLIVAQTGHLKVIDFGIAKASSRTLHTESGRVKGKLGYMSPEAVVGGPVGPPADVFSTAVVAHELLTIQPLFSAKTDYETLRRIREAEIPPPSRRNPRVPASLDRVVLAALERDDQRRLQTARGLRKALEQAAIEAGIWFSSSDVAEWWARGTTVGDHEPARESAPSTSRSAVMPAFSPSASQGSLSRIHPPAPWVLSGRRHQAHTAERRALPISAGFMAEQLRQDPLTDSDELPLGSEDLLPSERPSLVSTSTMPSPPAPARLRSPAHAVIALGILCTIAAGLAIYLFAVQPTAVVAPASSPAPTPPGPASVKFIVRPPDSIVEIGGKEVARRSPFEVPLDRGVYSIAVSHAGYKRWTSQITLADLESQTINVALEPAAAVVRVTSQPAGLVAELDGKPLEHVTPTEFEAAPGPHRLVVVGPTGTWPQDFVAANGGTHTFHAVLPAAKRAATAVTASGAVRTTTSVPDRTSPRTSSSSSARTSAAREPVFEIEDHATELGSDPVAGKLLTKAEPPLRPAGQPDPMVTPPPAPLRERPPSSTPPLVSASSVTKLSGELPAMASASASADVYSKICIGIDGRVTSVKIVKVSASVAAELQRTLLGWRYNPYLDDTGQASPACFAVNFRLVFERSHRMATSRRRSALLPGLHPLALPTSGMDRPSRRWVRTTNQLHCD